MGYNMGIIGMFAPNFALRMQENEERLQKEWFEDAVKKKKQVPWNGLTTKYEERLLIDAATYKMSHIFDSKPLVGEPTKRLKGENKKNMVWSPSKRFFYCNHLVPRGTPLTTCLGRKRGHVWFTDDVITPALCESAKHQERPKTWMGLTPMEMFTQRAGIRLACGRVVIGGLGLGWFLNEICLKKSVTQVVVVEKEKELIDWLMPRILEAYPAVKDKLFAACFGTKDFKIECDDIFQYMEADAANHFQTKYLLDIWPSYNDYDHRFFAWKKKLTPKHVWGWGQFDY